MLEEATDENFAQRLAELCPNAAGKVRPASPRDRRYNCFAWAVSDTQKPWVPGGDPETTRWPPGAPRELRLDAVVASYRALGFEPFEGRHRAALGFEPGEGRAPEPGVEFVALFLDRDGDVVHAARKLADGRWTSKLGQWEDVVHDDLAALEGGEYGEVGALLQRKVARSG